MSRFQFSLAIFSQSCQHISALKGSPLNKQSCWVLNCLWLIRSKDEGIEQERKSPSDCANATRPTLMWVEPEHAGETRISLGPAMFCLRLCSCQNNVGISLYPDTWPWRVGRGHSYFLTPSYSSLFTQWLFFFLTGLKKKKKCIPDTALSFQCRSSELFVKDKRLLPLQAWTSLQPLPGPLCNYPVLSGKLLNATSSKGLRPRLLLQCDAKGSSWLRWLNCHIFLEQVFF